MPYNVLNMWARLKHFYETILGAQMFIWGGFYDMPIKMNHCETKFEF
jgi:hypothetical protein